MKVSAITAISAEEYSRPRRNSFIRFTNSFMSVPEVENPIEKANDVRRRQVQTVLWHAVDVLVRLWAPILVHTCEEVNDFLHSEEESIHLGSFPSNFDVEDAASIKEKMDVLFALRTNIRITNDILKKYNQESYDKWYKFYTGESK